MSATSARPRAGRCWVPAKMTSSIFWDRTALGAWAPSTQPMASTTFDLPLPFGPTTTVTPGSMARRRRVGEGLEAFDGERLQEHGALRRVGRSRPYRSARRLRDAHAEPVGLRVERRRAPRASRPVATRERRCRGRAPAPPTTPDEQHDDQRRRAGSPRAPAGRRTTLRAELRRRSQTSGSGGGSVGVVGRRGPGHVASSGSAAGGVPGGGSTSDDTSRRRRRRRPPGRVRAASAHVRPRGDRDLPFEAGDGRAPVGLGDGVEPPASATPPWPGRPGPRGPTSGRSAPARCHSCPRSRRVMNRGSAAGMTDLLAGPGPERRDAGDRSVEIDECHRFGGSRPASLTAQRPLGFPPRAPPHGSAAHRMLLTPPRRPVDPRRMASHDGPRVQFDRAQT